MPIQYEKNLALFSGVVSGEEAESLLEWLQKWPAAKVDLATCDHMHPANIQVLIAAKTRVSAWPKDASFSSWLMTVLESA